MTRDTDLPGYGDNCKGLLRAIFEDKEIHLDMGTSRAHCMLFNFRCFVFLRPACSSF